MPLKINRTAHVRIKKIIMQPNQAWPPTVDTHLQQK